MKQIVILGCTGSIGTQSLDVIRMFPLEFQVAGISAKGSRPELLYSIIEEFQPAFVAVENDACAASVEPALKKHHGILIRGGEACCDLAAGKLCRVDMVISAQSGNSGVLPTIAALVAGIDVALANKETLVMGGEWVMDVCRESGSRIMPVDSEHSAIAQCLEKIHPDDVRRLILTCSGGPFTRRPDIDLYSVTPEQALAHPTWNMGRKISIDSATLMNKGLEIIEACRLFEIPEEHIDVVIHPQSIIHSMVETKDGSVLAQLSQPDMRHPVLYALSGGRHWQAPLPKLDFASLGPLSFSTPDTARFPCLNLARDALREGGTMTVVLNTANEMAVDAFCERRIGFMDIPAVIGDVMERHIVRPLTGIEAITEAAKWTEEMVRAGWKI